MVSVSEVSSIRLRRGWGRESHLNGRHFQVVGDSILPSGKKFHSQCVARTLLLDLLRPGSIEERIDGLRRKALRCLIWRVLLAGRITVRCEAGDVDGECSVE